MSFSENRASREINQEFCPWENTLAGPYNIGLRQSNYGVNLGDGLALPVSFRTETKTEAKEKVLTPTDLSHGYQITEEDFEYSTRRSKLSKLRSQLSRKIDSNIFSRTLVVDSSNAAIRDFGWLIDSSGRIGEIKLPEFQSRTLDALRLKLYLPNGLNYIARAKLKTFGSAITFPHFYPAETGPLSTSSFGFLDEGFMLAFPDDLDFFRNIKARFYREGQLNESTAPGRESTNQPAKPYEVKPQLRIEPLPSHPRTIEEAAQILTSNLPAILGERQSLIETIQRLEHENKGLNQTVSDLNTTMGQLMRENRETKSALDEALRNINLLRATLSQQPRTSFADRRSTGSPQLKALGLDQDALIGLTREQKLMVLESAFRARARIFHPDLYQSPDQKKEVEAKMKQVNVAYEQLRSNI